MKTFYRILTFLTVILLFTVSCQNDDRSHNEFGHREPKPELISFEEVRALIKDGEIQAELQNIGRMSLQKDLGDHDLTYFEVINLGRYKQYSLYVNQYSSERPYFLYFIITVDTQSVEKSGYLKYIPSVPSGTLFDIRKFTGEFQLLNDEMEIQAGAIFQQGQPTSTILTQGSGTTTCITELFMVTHTCTNGGEHSPGESCGSGYVNDAYYSLEAITTCTTTFDYTTPGTFIGGGFGGISNVDRFYYGLTQTQKNFLDLHPDIEAGIVEYIERTAITTCAKLMVDIARRDQQLIHLILNHMEENGYSQDSTRMASFAANYLTENTDVTAEEFDNWFLGNSEGNDSAFYNASYWENPNLTFEQQDLPSWEDFDDAYPRNPNGTYMTGADNVFGHVGGAVLQARIDHPTTTNNPCALKVSIALNGSGVEIPNIATDGDIPGTLEGADGKYYFLNAKALSIWMKKTFGTNPATDDTPLNTSHYQFDLTDGGDNGENFPDLLAGKKGIYIMLPEYPGEFNASGHCDKYDGDGCASKCYFEDASEVNIWVLP